jgi:hypothetical protein
MGSKSSKSKNFQKTLSDQEIDVLLANTKFTRPEIIAWHSGFMVFLSFISS